MEDYYTYIVRVRGSWHACCWTDTEMADTFGCHARRRETFVIRGNAAPHMKVSHDTQRPKGRRDVLRILQQSSANIGNLVENDDVGTRHIHYVSEVSLAVYGVKQLSSKRKFTFLNRRSTMAFEVRMYVHNNNM